MNKLDEMYATKERHVKEIGELMAKDPDPGVESADYVKAGASEYVKIAYWDGESVYINVTINSLGAIHKEMVREVYGPGAHGKVKSLPSVLYVAGLFDMKHAAEGKRGAMREILMKGLRLRAAREDGNGLCTIYKGIEKHLFIEEDREGDAVVFTRYDDIRRAIEEAGISVPDAWEIAKRNTEKHAVIRSVNEVLREMDPEYPKDDFPLYMISTDSGVYGAGAGLIPEVILRARKLTSAETMLVIPSSVSEMLFIPNASEDISRNVKEKLVREINEETTEEENWLQDTAYELTEKDFKEMERS